MHCYECTAHVKALMGDALLPIPELSGSFKSAELDIIMDYKYLHCKHFNFYFKFYILFHVLFHIFILKYKHSFLSGIHYLSFHYDH